MQLALEFIIWDATLLVKKKKKKKDIQWEFQVTNVLLFKQVLLFEHLLNVQILNQSVTIWRISFKSSQCFSLYLE